jgi:uncharacterized membrane protein YhaH (DUF805 family)
MDKPASYWMLEPLRKYASFSGRARRREYWWFEVFWVLVVSGLALIDQWVLGIHWDSEYGSIGPLAGLAVLFFFLPNLAVSVRRLHDRDRSGWWLLINVIPVIGFLFLFYNYISAGTPGDNRFGPDPKAGER